MTTTIKSGWRENGGTPFSHWLRFQDEIDSHKEHCSATNIDYVWSRYDQWMIIEEKQFLTPVKKWQLLCYEKLHNSIRNDLYKGFHILQFEHTNPDDGLIFLDSISITKNDLFEFLRFEKGKEKYHTNFSQILSL